MQTTTAVGDSALADVPPFVFRRAYIRRPHLTIVIGPPEQEGFRLRDVCVFLFAVNDIVSDTVNENGDTPEKDSGGCTISSGSVKLQSAEERLTFLFYFDEFPLYDKRSRYIRLAGWCSEFHVRCTEFFQRFVNSSLHQKEEQPDEKIWRYS